MADRDAIEDRLNALVDDYRFEHHEGGAEPTEFERMMLRDFAMRVAAIFAEGE